MVTGTGTWMAYQQTSYAIIYIRATYFKSYARLYCINLRNFYLYVYAR